MGGQPLTHPLGDSFYTQAPLRYGDYVAKIAVVPVSAELRALKGKPVDVRGRPNGLREAMIAFFEEHGAEWELRVQLRTNPDTMPIEDASVEWPEDESPYVPVARITVPRQPAWSEARARQVDDGLSFRPWHGLAAHRPLVSINRARKVAYEQAAAFRAERNGCPIHRPQARIKLSNDPAQTYGTMLGREGRRPGTPDAREGAWTQPLSGTAKQALVGAAALLVVGLVAAGIMRRRHARGPDRIRAPAARRHREGVGA
jgi:hypothetical protein